MRASRPSRGQDGGARRQDGRDGQEAARSRAAPPVEGPVPADQVNLTDEESRIMPIAGGGFEQCYNAQAVVAADGLLVVATDVAQAPNDKQQLDPMLGRLPDCLANWARLARCLPTTAITARTT